MPNFKITDYTELTEIDAADADLLEVVDLSDTTMDASGTNKRISLLSLKTWIGAVGGGITLWAEGSPVTTQRDIWDFRGNGVRIEDNVGDSSSRIIIDNANPVNVGGGAEVFRDLTGVDPTTVNLRTLVAHADGSIVITQLADTIEIQSTGGAGGGEQNTSSNQGTGVDINLVKNGSDLPKKALLAVDPTKLTVADGASNNIEFALVEGGVVHQNLGGAGSNTHAAIDNHIDASPTIHFTAASLAGAGIIQNAGALDVVGGEGITVNVNDVAATWGGDGAAATVARSDHDHSTNQIGTSGLADDAATNAKLADMVAHTVKIGPVGGGNPQDVTTGDLTDLGLFNTGEGILGWDAAGTIGKFTSIAAPGSPTAAPGDMIVRGSAQDERLAIGGVNDVLTVEGGAPVWKISQAKHGIYDDYVLMNARGFLNFLGDGFTLVDGVGTDSTDFTITNQPSTTGDLWTYSGGSPQRLPVGTLGQVLTVGASSLLEWGAGGGGGGDVSSALDTVDDEVQVGAAGSNKDIESAGFTSAVILRNDAASTVGSAVGFAGTSRSVASGGTHVPAPTGGQWVLFTGSTATTIGAMTEDGSVAHVVPDGLTVDVSAYIAINTQSGGRANLLETVKIGANLFAVWS